MLPLDFYFKFLSSNENAKSEKCYFFSSFFLTTELIHNGLHAAADDDSIFPLWFDSVRKWTQHDNIFEKKYLFIPVNYDKHWSMIVVCNPGNILCNDEEIPAFICMDSLKLHPLDKICVILRRYIEEEWKNQKTRQDEAIKMKEVELVNAVECQRLMLISQLQLKKSNPLFRDGTTIPSRITARNFPDVHPDVPAQNNSYDCGVYILKYAAWFFESIKGASPIRITQKSVARKLEGVIHKNIFSLDDIKKMRKDIQAILQDLSFDAHFALTVPLTPSVRPPLKKRKIMCKGIQSRQISFQQDSTRQKTRRKHTTKDFHSFNTKSQDRKQDTTKRRGRIQWNASQIR